MINITIQSKKGKTPKCKHCLQWVDKSLNEFIKNSKGYYHNECHEIVSLEAQRYKDLIEYIVNLYKVESPTGWMTRQIKEYKEKKNYTYIGMQYTLMFMYEVENVHLLEAKDSGLGLIPYYYEKAKHYYSNLQSVKDSIKDVKIDSTPQIIYVKPKEINNRKKKINIEDL